jgi:threonine dehydrogenase-like Zn-dependent dehydrogenase
VIDAVGMEAHGSPGAAFAQRVTAHLPDAVTEPSMKKAGLDRLAALYTAIETIRRDGIVTLSRVYGGMADPMPMMSSFDNQIQLRMGQANVKRWIPDIMPSLTDEEPARRG